MLVKLRNSVFAVLVGAFAIRVAYELIAPVIPLLVVLAVLGLILGSLFRRGQG